MTTVRAFAAADGSTDGSADGVEASPVAGLDAGGWAATDLTTGVVGMAALVATALGSDVGTAMAVSSGSAWARHTVPAIRTANIAAATQYPPPPNLSGDRGREGAGTAGWPGR
ncbi:hypothetical protein GCM10009810_03490 [Nostocoides vanveenii]|uniref:Uncharacterized protein n=1 Tax=Nostocoides vanveenii TaxID=330835 RepID=A0ABN2K169_9MICO